MGSVDSSAGRAWRAGVAVAALLASGCAHSGSNVAQSPPHRGASAGIANVQPASPASTAASTAAWTVFLSGDIVEACGIPTSQASFGFDPDQPSPRARAAMGRLSSCVHDGPLAGRLLSVVGHADPIARQPQDGEKLGLWRAEGVRRYLGLQGVAASAVAGSPPDVENQDDTGIAYERRVDIELVP